MRRKIRDYAAFTDLEKQKTDNTGKNFGKCWVYGIGGKLLDVEKVFIGRIEHVKSSSGISEWSAPCFRGLFDVFNFFHFSHAVGRGLEVRLEIYGSGNLFDKH